MYICIGLTNKIKLLMIKFSEYVSLGHPDKIADYISEYLLDRFIEQDKNTKYAVEVQIKDNYVTLGGEVTSNADISNADIDKFVREAVNSIGYTKNYQLKWGKENTISGDDLQITNHIGRQSAEIAQGVNENEGWGDQGIFFGYAEPIKETEGMPFDYALARRVNKMLFDKKLGGLDIKTEVIIQDDKINKIIAAVPTLTNNISEIKNTIGEYIVHNYKIDDDFSIIVNGTGTYKCHSSIADCGVTGRKLAVDFYGGNQKVGGGSVMSKDGSKADVTLNLFARQLAKTEAFRLGESVESSIACCIGQSEILVSLRKLNCEHTLIYEKIMDVKPHELIERLGLNKPIYASMCKWGLFGEFQKDKKWENIYLKDD